MFEFVASQQHVFLIQRSAIASDRQNGHINDEADLTWLAKVLDLVIHILGKSLQTLQHCGETGREVGLIMSSSIDEAGDLKPHWDAFFANPSACSFLSHQ